MRKISILFIVFHIIMLCDKNIYADDISCRYITDYKENSNETLSSTPTIPKDTMNPTTFEMLGGIIDGAKAVYQSIDNDIFLCTYKRHSNDTRENSVIFLERLRDKEIIPVFLYKGLVSKFYEEYNYEDVNSPFSQKRDENALEQEFVFRKRSIKSTIKFFGFIYPKIKKIQMWSVNKENGNIKFPTEEEWSEIKEEYLN